MNDEVKNNKKEQQQKVKGLSNAIGIIAKIGRILLIICLPIILFAMIIMPYLINSTTIKDDEIIFKIGKYPITIKEFENHVVVTYKEEKIEEKYTGLELIKIREIYQEYSKTEMIIYVEVASAILFVTLVLVRIIFIHNVCHIQKMAYLMIVLIILSNVSARLLE